MRAATRQAMRLLGSHFVLGQTIEEALGARRLASRISLFLRHAGRGRAHRRRRRALFRCLCRCDRRDRQDRRQRRAAASSRHFGQAVGAASALRAVVARARACRTVAARARAGAARKASRAQFHRRCRGGRPARTVARGHRRDIARSLAAPDGMVSALRCRPIRSAPGR